MHTTDDKRLVPNLGRELAGTVLCHSVLGSVEHVTADAEFPQHIEGQILVS